ncbi:hypothetical protein [Sphingomonas lenta]|uniref:Uncharacterized protein n=1 Tax=Sphingomonas lenta TaxID=1141887 RepID=A0A2A2SEF6_9SPHN|nr:hypothetical protein [Sphingomonas lenta]PAX07628.1 hypothetical protein CKY28_08230 [Sphingomonas lenta]
MSTKFDPEHLLAAERAEADARQAIGRAKRIVKRSRDLLLGRHVGSEPIGGGTEPIDGRRGAGESAVDAAE